MRFTSFFIATLISLGALAQDHTTLDSLRSALGTVSDYKKMEIYQKLAWEFRKAYPDSTIIYAQRAIELLDQEQLSKNRSEALNFIGVGYHYKGENIKSFDFYIGARDEALKYGDTLQYAHSLNNLGSLYLDQGSFIKAYDHYYEALDYFDKIDNVLGQSYAYKSLAELYQTQNNMDKALEMSEKTLAIRVKLNDIIGQVSILVELASIYVGLNDLEKAFEYYLQAKVKSESIGDKMGIARVNLGISQLYHHQGKEAEALIYAQRALTTTQLTNNEDLLNQIRLQMAKVLIKTGREEDAKVQLMKVASQAGSGQQLELDKDVYFYLSQISRNKGDFQEAFEHFERYNELSQAWESAEAARMIERLESRMALENKERENELLRLNEARSTAVIGRQRFQNIALISVLTLIAILLVSIWYVSRKRKQMYMRLQLKNRQIEEQASEISEQSDKINQQYKKLKERNDELADLNAEKDILMNIVAHDLKSPVNRVKGISELLGFTELNDEQRNFVNLLRQISTSGIDLIRDLLDVNAFEGEARKLNLAEVDIPDLLLNRKIAFATEANSKGIIIEIEVDETELIITTDDSLLIRILDNLLSNAIKFSNKGTTATLAVRRRADYVELAVKDQGPGFTEDDKKNLYQKFKKLSAQPTGGESSNGLGLAIVKILSERLGIQVELNTDADTGSEFILKFPLAMAKRPEVALKP